MRALMMLPIGALSKVIENSFCSVSSPFVTGDGLLLREVAPVH
jgi:hypothetical protein